MSEAQVIRDLELLGRLVIALVLSGVLGWEREQRGKAAGLRTHMLVGGSAAIFVLVGEGMINRYGEASSDAVQVDMTRVLSAVATGISFLGAGMVFVSRNNVHGLTTAASILATSGIGIAVGLEQYVLAVGATLMLFIVLRVLGWLED